MSRYAISTIMPALNEELNLRAAVQNVIDSYARLGLQGEIVVVNDGSNDRTGALAEELQSDHDFVRVVHHATPQGIGAAFWDGVQAAGGELVVMLPGDGENDAAEIFQYLPLLAQVDIVIPFIFNKEIRPFKRRLLSNLYTRIINLSFGTSINHTNGTVVYRRCLLDGITLKAGGFFFQTELLIKLIRRGYLFAEVPYALRKREGGESKALSLKTLRNVIVAYLSLLADVVFAPGRVYAVHADSVTARRRQ